MSPNMSADIAKCTIAASLGDMNGHVSMITNQNRLSPYLGFLLYFHKSQSYTLCNYT